VLVERPLDRAHHLHRAFTGFGAQEIHLVQTNPVFAGAGDAQCQGAHHQFVVQVFCGGAHGGVVGINQISKMEIAIAHMTYQKVGQP